MDVSNPGIIMPLCSTLHSLCVIPPLPYAQVMVEERASLVQERAQLQAGEASLRSRVGELECSLERVQEELGRSHAEVETLRGGCG